MRSRKHLYRDPAPRQLDRNVTLLGRVVQGIELLSTLPRGTAAMGFYEKPEQHVPIKSLRVAADVQTQAVMEVADAITPVPGGTGPTTVAVLAEQTLRAAELRHDLSGDAG